jgi:D-xylose transport system substrate-binding protein
MHLGKKFLIATLSLLAATGIAACGGSGSTTKTTNTPSGGSTPTASISLSQLNNTFSAMSQLKSVAAKGTGSIAAILPDTTSSQRWTEFDAPYITEAALKAGIPKSDINVQNAKGSDSTFYAIAQADIAKGATVLLTTPEDSATGARVERYAAAHGVKVIDYDRLTLGGSRPYYVSFNNVTVGQKIGQGYVSCVNNWDGHKQPSQDVLVMHGAATDNNATLFYQGYNGVIAPLVKSGKYKAILGISGGNLKFTAGTWDPPTQLKEFQAIWSKDRSSVTGAIIPNDETGSPILNFLHTQGVKPYTFPMTGQDATPPGLQGIVAGYQCGTVYKPVFLEAGAAVALAVYLRAGEKPPASLVNSTTPDTTEHKNVPSALLTPEWVTQKNIKSTVLADNFVPKKDVCVGTFNRVNLASACAKEGI